MDQHRKRIDYYKRKRIIEIFKIYNSDEIGKQTVDPTFIKKSEERKLNHIHIKSKM